MKQFLVILALAFAGTGYAYAAAEEKEVCNNKTDNKGQVVKDKEGNPVKVCKKIKVHKKYEGTDVPENKKK